MSRSVFGRVNRVKTAVAGQVRSRCAVQSIGHEVDSTILRVCCLFFHGNFIRQASLLNVEVKRSKRGIAAAELEFLYKKEYNTNRTIVRAKGARMERMRP